MDASDEIVSTINSAGCRAASMAPRTAAMSLVTPVEVSLWTTQTAWIACPASSASRASISAASTPRRQSPGRNSGSRPSRVAMPFQRVAKWPVSAISTRTPGDSVLTSAASQAPVPDAGNSTTGCRVPITAAIPASTSRVSAANSGPRWSMVGAAIARRTRSGTLVGPGI